MSTNGRLVEEFLTVLTPPHRVASAELPALEEVLVDALARARAAWPGVELDASVYAAHLAARLPAELEPVATLRKLECVDLYLACACARGDRRAHELFDHHFIQGLGPTLGRVGASGAVEQELKQLVRCHVLIANGDAPRIADYSGRGPLHAWLRIVAVREAIRFLRKSNGADLPLDDDVLEVSSPLDAPDLEHMKALYRAEFREAFRAAMATLTERERNLLRHRFIDRLSVDEVGTLYRIHRATAARWIADAHAALLAAVRRALRDRLGTDGAELQSILRLIESRPEVSIERLLGPQT